MSFLWFVWPLPPLINVLILVRTWSVLSGNTKALLGDILEATLKVSGLRVFVFLLKWSHFPGRWMLKSKIIQSYDNMRQSSGQRKEWGETVEGGVQWGQASSDTHRKRIKGKPFRTKDCIWMGSSRNPQFSSESLYFWRNNFALGFSFLLYKSKRVTKMMGKDAASLEIQISGLNVKVQWINSLSVFLFNPDYM